MLNSIVFLYCLSTVLKVPCATKGPLNSQLPYTHCLLWCWGWGSHNMNALLPCQLVSCLLCRSGAQEGKWEAKRLTLPAFLTLVASMAWDQFSPPKGSWSRSPAQVWLSIIPFKSHPCCCKWQNFHSFLWLNSISFYIYIYITSPLSSHLLMDTSKWDKQVKLTGKTMMSKDALACLIEWVPL